MCASTYSQICPAPGIDSLPFLFARRGQETGLHLMEAPAIFRILVSAKATPGGEESDLVHGKELENVQLTELGPARSHPSQVGLTKKVQGSIFGDIQS